MIYQTYLPLIIRDLPKKYGCYWYSTVVEKYIVKNQWVKLDVPWREIEDVQGTYAWPEVLDRNIAFLNSNRNPVMFNFHNSPAWARDTSTPCTLPNESHLNDYVEFILATIDRYRPAAIEIWNEPESNSTEESIWCCGCVGDAEIPYYTTLLNRIHDVVKFKYPSVYVIGGALTQGDTQWVRSWLTTNPRMDALSFHYYARYYTGGQVPSTSGLEDRISDLSWRSGKPVWLTETSLLSSVDSPDFREQQANWLSQVASLRGLFRVFWFSQNQVGWENCNMLDERRGIVHPVYSRFVEIVKGQ